MDYSVSGNWLAKFVRGLAFKGLGMSNPHGVTKNGMDTTV